MIDMLNFCLVNISGAPNKKDTHKARTIKIFTFGFLIVKKKNKPQSYEGQQNPILFDV